MGLLRSQQERVHFSQSSQGGVSLSQPLAHALRDRYHIEREIGAGGMATVYLARDLRHDRRVALKVLRPELAAALGPERFLREITITAQLDHPHILPLLDSGEADGTLYYVMPFVEGESLRDRLAREKQTGTATGQEPNVSSGGPSTLGPTMRQGTRRWVNCWASSNDTRRPCR